MPLPAPARAAPAALLVGLLLLYGLTSPAVVNGDGLGYLRQAMGEGLAPGHVAYLPVLRAMAGSARAPLELEPRARWLSILCAIFALGLFLDGARRLRGHGPALFATALLGLSHGFFRSAQEVEVYAAAVLCAMACLSALLRMVTGPPDRSARWALIAGSSCGLAVLFHLSLALLVPSLLFLLGRLPPPGQRRRSLLLGAGALALTAGLPLLLILHHQVGLRPAAAWAWVRSADHGLPYPHTIYTPLVAIWGLLRSLVHAPYPYQASLAEVLLLSAAGALAWLGLALLWRRRRAAKPLPPSARLILVAWTAPLALFGVLFYPSDTERWIFVLPAAALLLAPAAGRAGWAVLGAVALLNLAGYALPLALDDAPVRRAAAVDALTRPDDLVLSPGNSWDELIGLRSERPPRRMLLVYFVGAERDVHRGVQRLKEELERTFDAGGRVFVARLRDEDPRGFKELARLGLDRQRFAALFAPYRPRQVIAGLWLLTPP